MQTAMSHEEGGPPPRKLSRQEDALVSTLRQNIARYLAQLDAGLGDDERRFVERCLAEEQAMLTRITGRSGS